MKMEWLERKVVFRASRGFFVGVAGFVLLGLIGSVLLLGYAISPTIQGFGPNEPEPPAPPEVSPNELLSRIGETQDEEVVKIPEDELPPPDMGQAFDLEEDALVEQVENLLLEIRKKFPEGDEYPWESIKHRKNTIKRGASDWLKRGGKRINNEQKIILLESIISMFPLLVKTPPAKYTTIDQVELPAKPQPIPELPPEQWKELSKKEKKERKNEIKQYKKDLKKYNWELENIKKDLEKQKKEAIETRQEIVWQHQLDMIGALVDIRLAYGESPERIYSTIKSLFQGEGENPVALSDWHKKAYFKVILNIRKAGSDPRALGLFTKNWKQIADLLPENNLIVGMSSLWDIVRSLPLEVVEENMLRLSTILSNVPDGKRHQAVAAYGTILEEKQRQALRAYSEAKYLYEKKIDQREKEYIERESIKKGYRNYALYGIGIALLGLALVGLILASLAIERNTRTLELLLNEMKPENMTE